ncbi:MAG: hypothetical protein C0490_23980 [Marivirga sp.]|nr:hypothetical protein [Marivirga sp.]
MKALKGLLLFGISTLLMGACFNPPEFPITPVIDYESIYFKEASGPGVKDSLVFTISFKDGDGDLGLSSTQIDPPYHDVNFYLANDGELIPVGKYSLYNNLPQFIDIPNNVTGKLVTVRTEEDPVYASKLPSFNDPYSCTFYTYTSIYVSEEDKEIFDEGTHNLDSTLVSDRFPNVYILLDTFYYQRNPNYANIEVEFLVKEGGEYVVFDWEKEFCTISFNQRFPILSEKEGPLEGDLQYAIVTSGIRSIFSIKPMKLRIKIRDRALNTSNTVETPEFTLDKI